MQEQETDPKAGENSTIFFSSRNHQHFHSKPNETPIPTTDIHTGWAKKWHKIFICQ